MLKDMKITKFLMAFLLLIPFFQACQDDISDLEDPRDAIAKSWHVTESTYEYTCRIGKDAAEITRVYFYYVAPETGFHNLGLSDKLYATLSGNLLTIAPQTIDGYTISGSGTIASDLKSITFNYTVQEGADDPVDYTALFGEIVITKKKSTKPPL
jgi:hypothetical protein